MLDNTNPGFLPNGFPVPAVQGPLPPSPVKTIGDALNGKRISWAYFGGSYNDAVALSNDAVAANPANPNLTAAALADPAHALGVAYCQICNPFQYATSIMGDAKQRAEHIKDTADLITDIQNNTLPAVSVGKPDGLLDGHPQSSKIDLFEAYVENVLDTLEKHPRLKATTAVFITWDEAGGYWDSGFVQPIDYFGDGPRIPLLVLSPYSTGGMVNHRYGDHVSLLKFIERNWRLQPLTDSQPRQSAQSDCQKKQSLCSDQHAGAGRSVRQLRLCVGTEQSALPSLAMAAAAEASGLGARRYELESPPTPAPIGQQPRSTDFPRWLPPRGSRLSLALWRRRRADIFALPGVGAAIFGRHRHHRREGRPGGDAGKLYVSNGAVHIETPGLPGSFLLVNANTTAHI